MSSYQEMTGAEAQRAAQGMASRANEYLRQGDHEISRGYADLAQVYATLAMAQATLVSAQITDWDRPTDWNQS